MIENKHFKEKLKQKILSYKPDFTLEILNIGVEKFKLTEHKAGDFLVRAGDSCKSIFIAESSITRGYFLGEDGEDKTVWVSPKMDFFTDYECFSSQIISRSNVQLYQDSLVYQIDRDCLLELYMEYHEWAIMGISIVEGHFINLLKLRTAINFNDATKNYQFVEKHFSQYLDVVPMKHLASWLNISPVHLSRIRKESIKFNVN